MSVVVLASHAYTGSSRFRARVSSDRLAEVRKASSQRFMTVAVLVVALFCTYAAIRTLIGGVNSWWLWFLAAAAQFGAVALAQPVAGAAARLDNGFIGAASIVLRVAALGGFVAAGWAVVWVSRERKPDKDPVAPRRTSDRH